MPAPSHSPLSLAAALRGRASRASPAAPPLLRRLALFAVVAPFVVAATPAPPAEAGQVYRYVVERGEAVHCFNLPHAPRHRWVALVNEGPTTVVNPRLVINGRRDWFSTPDILAGILRPGMNDRERALAIWRFLVDHRYHDGPAHKGIEMHDPVRFLNVYGYGFCDDSAVNFMVLARQAGLPARVWGLSGHVVPEAYFEGGWRLLDPDGQIYYLEDDGRTIAGVATVAQRPDLVHKYPSPYYKDSAKLAALYTSTDDNQVSEWYQKESEASHTMAFRLRPGEALIRHHDNWGLYFASRDPNRPPKNTAAEHYGNGRFSFAPIFADGLFAQGADTVDGLRAERDASGWRLSSTDRAGTLVYRFAGPYPYLDGAVSIAGRGRLSLAFAEADGPWTEVWASAANAKVETTVPLARHFRTREGRPVYSYRLRLTVDGEVRTLRFQSDIQCAPASLPALENGDNSLHYRDATPGHRRLRIELGWDPPKPE